MTEAALLQESLDVGGEEALLSGDGVEDMGEEPLGLCTRRNQS